MDKKIKILDALKSLECDQFVLTGSFALQCLGFDIEAGDLDIILVNPAEDTKKLLKQMENFLPAPTHFLYDAKGVIFMMDGIKVDAFFVKEKIQTDIKLFGIDVKPIKEIILAKKRCNRIKDWNQLRRLALSIFDEKTFLNKLYHGGVK